MNQLSQEKYADLVAKGYSPAQIASEARRRGFSLPATKTRGATEEGKSVGGFVGNAASSFGKAGAEIVGGLAAAVASPIKTAGALGSVALGGVQKLIPGKQDSEEVFDSLADSMSEKYKDGLFNALYTDPFGVALDASTVLGGGGIALRAAGAAGNLAKVGKAASVVSKVGKAATVAGDVVDPLYWAMKATGKVAGVAATGVSRLAGAADDAAVSAAARLGIKETSLPAGTFRESALIPGVEAVAARSLTGGKLAEKFTTGSKTIDDAATALRQKLTSAEPTDFASIGRIIADTIQASEDSLRKVRNSAYEVALNLKGTSKAKLDPAPITDAIKSVESTYSGVKGFKSELKTAIEEIKSLVNANTKDATNVVLADGSVMRQMSLKSARAISGRIDEIEKSVGFNSPVMQQLRPIQEAITNVADNSLKSLDEKRWDALQKAKELHGSLKDLGREGVTVMAKNAMETGNYERLASLVLSSSVSSESLSRLLKAMSPEQVNVFRANVFNSIIDGAKKTSDGQIRAGSITTQLRGAREAKVRAVIGDYGVEGLRAIERISESFSRASKTYGGSQTAAQASLAADFALASSAVTALLTGNLGASVAAASMFGGKQALQKFFSSDWGQAWLRNGMDLRRPVDVAGGALQEARRAAVVTGGVASEL